jgi:hypothetical protein
VIVFVRAAVRSALSGSGTFKWFLLDFAAQSRFLIVTPLLILAGPPLFARLEAVARQFLNEDLVRNPFGRCHKMIKLFL